MIHILCKYKFLSDENMKRLNRRYMNVLFIFQFTSNIPTLQFFDQKTNKLISTYSNNLSIEEIQDDLDWVLRRRTWCCNFNWDYEWDEMIKTYD